MITLGKEAPQNKFTLIKNAFHTDYNLSDGAFRLLFHLMSLPNQWEINWEQIAKTLRISFATLKRRKKELIEKNILQRQKNDQKNNHQHYFINNQAELKEINEINEIETTEEETKEAFVSSKNERVKNERVKNERVKNEPPYIYNNTESKNTKYYLSEFFDVKKLFSLSTTALEDSKVKNQKGLLGIEEYFNEDEIPLVSEWVAHKRKFKVSQKRILDELLKAKEKGNLKESINHSLNHGYRGLFPPKNIQAECKKPSRERILEIWGR